MYKMNLVLLLLLLTFYDILLSYSFVFTRIITAPGIPVRRNNTLSFIANLVLTYLKQGWWKKAKKLYIYILEIDKRVVKEEYLEMLSSMANLVLIYREQGR